LAGQTKARGRHHERTARLTCRLRGGLCFVGAATLIAVSLCLVLDMNVPFHGPMQVSDAPLLRAASEIAF
jgi:hypothetical protein